MVILAMILIFFVVVVVVVTGSLTYDDQFETDVLIYLSCFDEPSQPRRIRHWLEAQRDKPVASGLLYSTLDSLEARLFVVRVPGSSATEYRITEVGLSHLAMLLVKDNDRW